MILKIQMVECSECYKQLGVQEPVREGLEPRSEAQEETPEISVYHVISKVASKSWLKHIVIDFIFAILRDPGQLEGEGLHTAIFRLTFCVPSASP